MLDDLTPDQRKLAEFMSEISENAYCAGWMSGIEYELWGEILGLPSKYGHLKFSREEVATLIRLSSACGGWIVWDKEKDRLWVSRSDWDERFSKWQASRAADEDQPG